MWYAAWMLLFATVPQIETPISEYADLAELNHFYDDQGRAVFDQVIYYDWDRGHLRHQVRAWRLVKNPDYVPRLNRKTGYYEALWDDGDTLRLLHTVSMRESWTQFDPELVEREYLPKEQRQELYVKPKPPPPAGLPPPPPPEPLEP